MKIGTKHFFLQIKELNIFYILLLQALNFFKIFFGQIWRYHKEMSEKSERETFRIEKRNNILIQNKRRKITFISYNNNKFWKIRS